VSALSYVDAAILGLVEGLTEFLPVSSTGHLTIAEKLLGLRVDDPAVTGYTAVIQLPAILATFLYFRRDILQMVTAGVGGLFSPRVREQREFRFAWYVVAGSLPIVVVALLAKDLIEGPLRSLWVVAVALILWSGVMYVAEGRGRQKIGQDQLTLRQVVIIGLVQCIALVPGVSRSGATISAGLFQDIDRVTATRLSFFLAIPALTGAGVYSLKELDTTVIPIGPMLLGCAVSFVVAYASIAWLLKFVAGNGLNAFVGYRIALGTVLIGLLATNVLSAT
jgi:undecaprenyl-diphosphatase